MLGSRSDKWVSLGVIRVRRVVQSLLLLVLSLPATGSAQALVHPRRPGQTNVRYAHFDWHYADLLTNEQLDMDIEWQRGPRFHMGVYRPPSLGTPWAWPALSQVPTGTATTDAAEGQRKADTAAAPFTREVMETAGGVRLYFYERERSIAERAAASIEESYRYLAEQFAYAPRKTFAYFLYSSYIEFLQTELFPIQEGVLGVTSPESLDLTLPYFGDHRLFEDVSTHELAHEFTIQKLMTVAYEADQPEAPIMQMPLWFIEGLAEFYAKRGLDPEAEVLVRDLVINPGEGYTLGDFFEDRFTDGLWTYKVGQARCAFLEETYGKGTIQRILEESPRLISSPNRGGVSSFRALVAEVTGDRAARISARFEQWIKRRAFGAFLETSQSRADMGMITQVNGMVQTLSTAPSGQLLMYRSIDPNTGETSLYMLDRHSPGDTHEVVRDGVPGVESLHPVAGRNFDITDGALAYVAQAAGRDVIYVQRFTEEAVPEPCAEKGARASRVCKWDVDFELDPRVPLHVGDRGLLTVDAIAISPNGRGLAFVGLTDTGQRDLFLIPDVTDHVLNLVRLTNDVFAEREVNWGPRGIVFTSDATGHGKYNLFRTSAQTPGTVQRLTFEPRDELSPEMLPDGRVMYVAYDSAGANVYEVTANGAVLRHTDISTGLFDVSSGPDGSIWALLHKGHKRLPVRLAAGTLLQQAQPPPPTDKPATAPPRKSLLVDREYDPTSLQNWTPEGFFIMAGFSGEAVFGSLVATATDRLRDHGLILSTSVYGSFDLTDAEITYVNQERRLIWGLGIFHDVAPRFDETFTIERGRELGIQLEKPLDFVAYRRFFGASAVARYPFSRFMYVQGDLALGAADYFVTDGTADDLREFLPDTEPAAPGEEPPEPPAPVDLLTPWEAENDGLRFNTEAGIGVGYSTIGYHRATGPIRGSAILLSHALGTEPFDDVLYQQTRLDAEQYFPIIGAVNLMLRGAAGITVGDELAPQYYLSSFHTLRGVPFGDSDYLLGRDFFYSTVELQFPLVTFSEFPLIDLEGVLAADFGGVGDGAEGIWGHRVFDLVFGFNLGFAPIVLRVHFAQCIDIGVQPLPNDGDLTFNLSIVWRYR